MVDPIEILVDVVVNKAIDAAESFLKNKYHQLYEVTSEVERLESNLRKIRAVFKDAERRLSQPEQDSNHNQLVDWLSKLKDVALDVEDVLETYAAEAALRREKKYPSPLAWFCSRSKAASSIKEVVSKMDTISREKSELGFTEHQYDRSTTRRPSMKDGWRKTSCHLEKSDIIGRENEIKEIVAWLVSDDSTIQGRVPVFPILGMGGLGKTTLAQLVYNDERIHKKKDERCHFKQAMWVNVSADFDVDRILKEMVEFLTEMPNNMSSRSTVENRILEVLAGKNFLLVLDDVWPDKLDWQPLENFLKLCPKGSKVLVTSRVDSVKNLMGALSSINLDFLNPEECWKLFAKGAFISSEYPKDLEEIGRKIISKCDQLPLAVKAMGTLLCGNTDVDRWNRILQNGIWESELSRNHPSMAKILPALKLSYNDLSSQLKQCFAYCCIFPKGYMFEKTRVIKIWVAEGYIQPMEEDKIEEIGSDYFDELQARSFFQHLDINNKERYKMHDLHHDLAKSVSSYCHSVEEGKSVQIALNARHVSFIVNAAQNLAEKILTAKKLRIQNLAEKILKAKKLRTLLLHTNYATDFGKTLDQMFRTLSYLRVLDLNSSIIKDLPKSVGELKLLRYLDLSRTEIRELPNTICNLLNLQTLRLLQCVWLLGLPRDLGNMKNLRHLELDDIFWYNCRKLPSRIGNLTNLHNMSIFQVGRESGYRINELQLMNYLKGSLHISNLENAEDAQSAELKEKECVNKLVLEWTDQAADPEERIVHERALEDLEPQHRLEELHIKYFKGNKFPCWMGILSNLKRVSLKHCKNCRILSLGSLPNLSDFRIKGLLELVQWPADRRYESLTWLSISNCPQLRELPDEFPILRVAKIKQCDALTVLPLMPSLMFLRLINNTALVTWHKTIVPVTPINDQGGRVFTVRVSFMKLLELRIISCPSLQELPLYFAPQKLEISGCTSLRGLPNNHYSQRLQCLELDNCIGTSLIEAIPTTTSLYSLVISNVSNLVSLPQLPHLPGLKALYIDNCEDLQSSSQENGSLQSMESLKLVSISGCRQLVTFPSEGLPTSIECLSIKDCSVLHSFHPRNCLTSLTSLKDLYLEDCPLLEFLPEDGLPTSLGHLYIRGCPLLIEKCKDTGGQYWPMISYIADLEMDVIKNPEPETHQSVPAGKSCFSCFSIQKIED